METANGQHEHNSFAVINDVRDDLLVTKFATNRLVKVSPLQLG